MNHRLRNRIVHQRDRDLYYQKAVKELNFILERFDEWFNDEGDLQTLMGHVDKLVKLFEKAWFHAVQAIGGNPSGSGGEAPVEMKETAYIDYLKTMHSSVKNIKSHLRHEIMLKEIAQNQDDLTSDLKEYIQNVTTCDENIAKKNLEILAERILIFDTCLAIGTI